VTDYADRFPEATAALAAWRNAGRLHLDEDVLDGIERAPEVDQAIVLPCASVMVIIVLLKDAFT
jgi:NADPH-dependent curcumin reductase CurA